MCGLDLLASGYSPTRSTCKLVNSSIQAGNFLNASSTFIFSRQTLLHGSSVMNSLLCNVPQPACLSEVQAFFPEFC